MKKMLEYFFINLLLSLALQGNANAQDKLKFGLNQPHLRTDFVKMVSDTVNYSDFFSVYHIQ
jgi:hypothetical protein